MLFLNKATEGISKPILMNNISKCMSPEELHTFGVKINNIIILWVKIPQKCLKLARIGIRHTGSCHYKCD